MYNYVIHLLSKYDMRKYFNTYGKLKFCVALYATWNMICIHSITCPCPNIQQCYDILNSRGSLFSKVDDAHSQTLKIAQAFGLVQKYTLNNHFQTILISLFYLKKVGLFSHYFDQISYL